MSEGLDEILTGEQPEPEAVEAQQPEQEPQPEPEVEAEKPTQPRDESGKFAPKEKGEKEQGEPPSSEPNVPRAALMDERRKRQELEDQIAALQRQMQSKPQDTPPGFWDDPDKAIESRISQAAIQAIEQYEQRQTMQRIEASEREARAKYDDYGDAFRAFQSAAQANPALIQQMTQADNPAEFAYTKGKTAMQLEQVGSIDELLKAERAKWEAEQAAQQPAPKPAIPETLADEPASRAPAGDAPFSPPSLGDILKGT